MKPSYIDFLAEYSYQHDINFVNDIIINQYCYDYVIINYQVVNAGIIFEDATFTNDFYEHFNDMCFIGSVDEINNYIDKINDKICSYMKKRA